MCIHFFAPGKVITIRMLVEQIWLFPQYGGLAIEEVYDVAVQNDDRQDIAEFWVLYPHGLVNAADAGRPHVLQHQLRDHGDPNRTTGCKHPGSEHAPLFAGSTVFDRHSRPI